ncbi:MAG: hypothetical protein RID53_05325 [Coleofasciculus sp. B1-GNL1-01]|uniref:hypothetical protein n=1 Tax=Coleofasciculus sp. B1-GNL1-01 TaxID=3068484 RepID=UPI0032F5F2C8
MEWFSHKIQHFTTPNSVIPGYDIIKDSLGVLASKGLVFKSLGASLLKNNNNNIWRDIRAI